MEAETAAWLIIIGTIALIIFGKKLSDVRAEKKAEREAEEWKREKREKEEAEEKKRLEEEAKINDMAKKFEAHPLIIDFAEKFPQHITSGRYYYRSLESHILEGQDRAHYNIYIKSGSLSADYYHPSKDLLDFRKAGMDEIHDPTMIKALGRALSNLIQPKMEKILEEIKFDNVTLTLSVDQPHGQFHQYVSFIIHIKYHTASWV